MTDWCGGRDPVAQMTAGNELLMPGTGRQRRELLGALESGALKEDVLDRNVERVLALVRRTPVFHHAAHGDHPDLKAHAEEARQAAAEGMVLLRNQGALPLRAPAKVALFGNSAYSTIIGGTGSGDVNEAYVVSLAQGLKDAGLSVDGALAEAYPRYIKEAEGKRPPMPMPFLLPPPIAEMTVSADEISRLAREADLALVSIGRNSGEFRDRTLENDFDLSSAEKSLLQAVASAVHAQNKKLVVVLNVGGVIESASSSVHSAGTLV